MELLFILTTAITVFLYYKATAYKKRFLLLISCWLLLQTLLSSSGFYLVTTGTPPRFALLLFPPLVFIVVLFILPKGRSFLDQLDAGWLTLLHSVRLPVELVLYGLSLHRAVPQSMTFEGRNFDILSGLTAPLIWYLGYQKKWLGKLGLLVWNMICLGLLANVVWAALTDGLAYPGLHCVSSLIAGYPR